LKNGDLDALITQFKSLVQHANYDINQPLVLQIFTNTLPHNMYEFIIKHIQPCDYEGWQEAAVQQQKDMGTHEELTKPIQSQKLQTIQPVQ
jgi:hypothetical protein